MPSRKPNNSPIYQLKVTLQHSKPPIWRRLQVPSDIGLTKLHRVIQTAMGWEDYHLHQFIVGNQSYGVPDPDFMDDIKSERTVKLNKVLTQPKAKIIYEYDFGDSWQHEILLETILEPEPEAVYPRCLTGKRACPPEDCGGVWGYERFLATISDPNDPEHAELLEWVGGEFDPEAFDCAGVNRKLQKVR